jgi:hypothetical protein
MHVHAKNGRYWNEMEGTEVFRYDRYVGSGAISVDWRGPKIGVQKCVEKTNVLEMRKLL